MLRPLSLCAALAAVTVTLAAPSAAAAEPDDRHETEGSSEVRTTQVSRRASRPAASTPLTITIDGLSPSTVPERGPIEVSGTVTNTDTVPWVAVNVYSFVSAEPLTTTADLVTAAASDPAAEVGERIIQPGNFASIDEIAPGATERFAFKVSKNRLEADSAGVYWFGVHALGERIESGEGRDLLADGRARTFLPYVPPERPGQVAMSIVIPLRHSLDRAADGSMADVAGWTKTLSSEGRLRSLVDFGAASGSRSVTWVIDAALVDAVRRLAAGNPPRYLGPTVEPGGGEGEGEGEPEDSPSAAETPSPEPTADGSGSPEGEEAELDPAIRAAAEAARSWLDNLRAALAGGDEALLLPFGDTDVSGAARHDREAYPVARLRAGDVLAPLEVGADPVVASPSGFLSAQGLRSVEDGTTVLVTDQMFGANPPVVARTGGHEVVVTSTAAVAGGPGPDDARSPLAMRQRLLAEAAVRFLTARRPPLVAQLPPDWWPTSTLGFFSGLDVPWLDLASVRQAVATARVRPVPIERLRYPESQAEAELDSANFTAANQLADAGVTLERTLTLNDQVGVEVTDEALGSVSYSARQRPNASRAAAERSQTRVDETLRQVEVRAPTAVTLSSSSGRFAATVRNKLDQPVTVAIEARSDPDLSVEPAPEIDVPAKGRQTVLLNAGTEENGIHDVTLVLTDAEGNPIGATTELSIRSAQVSNVIWLFIGGGLALLFVTIGVRLVRRVRASLRSGGGHAARGDDPDDPDDVGSTVSAGAVSQ